ncbi:MAG: AAA family ATPase [Thermotogae bacterium]|nr:AAA family ATPase [Thermotogota bacterium]
MSSWEKTAKWLKGKKIKADWGEKKEEILEYLNKMYENSSNPPLPVLKIKDGQPYYEFEEVEKAYYFSDKDIEDLGIKKEDLAECGVVIVYAGNEEKINGENIKVLLEPDDAHLDDDLPVDLLKSEGVYIFKGEIYLKINGKSVKSEKGYIELNEKKLFKDKESFEQDIWDYIFGIFQDKLEIYKDALDTQRKSMIAMQLQCEDKKIAIFKDGIRVKIKNTDKSYHVPGDRRVLGDKILYKNWETFGKDCRDIFNEINKDDIKFFVENKMKEATSDIIIDIVKEYMRGSIKEQVEEHREDLIKPIKEAIEKLSKPDSTHLTFEWLIYAIAWEYLQESPQSGDIKIFSPEILYVSKDKIIFPTQYSGNADLWEIKKFEIYLSAKEPIYSSGKLQNLGWRHEGIVLKIKTGGWKGGMLKDEIEITIGNKKYKYKLNINKQGEIEVDGYSGDGTGYINGRKVTVKDGKIVLSNVKDGKIVLSNPLPLKIQAVLEYNVNAGFKKEIAEWLARKKYNDDDTLKDIIENKLLQVQEKQIEFVWGPPATGKTTYVACQILDALKEGKKIIALTPTNKAADVLTERVINIDDSSRIYRYPSTMSDTDEIPSDNILQKGKGSSLESPYAICTTIHRFIQGDENFKDMDWDLVIIDEASMVDVAFMMYTLDKSKAKKFIIAGDPNQLTPVGETPDRETPDKGELKGYSTENIYTVMGIGKNMLKKVKETKKVKKTEEKAKETANDGSYTGSYTGYGKDFKYKVINRDRYNINILKTQYRSVRDIGEIYNRQYYEGILEHGRTDPPDVLEIKLRDQEISLSSLNVIKFDISSNSPYDPNKIYKLNRSSFHITSAVLACELAEAIEKEKKYSDKSIGIISPYKAQVNIMKSLTGTYGLNLKNTTVSTVHGFQGDERDIIIVVMNPPSESPDGYSHFNNERIVNVAISRPRDHLIILMPKGIKGEINKALEKAKKSEPKSESKSELKSKPIPIQDISTEAAKIIQQIQSDIEILNHLDVQIYQSNFSIGNPAIKKYTFYLSKSRGYITVVDIIFSPLELSLYQDKI